MNRLFVVTVLRNMARSPVQSLITVGGLAIGLAAAILAGLVIANQASFDDFLPSHDHLYMATVEAMLGGRPTEYFPNTPRDLAARLKQNFPEIEAVTRIRDADHSLRHGDIEARETMYSADPNVFDLLRFPVLYGNLETSLAQPDTIVIPRETARKYFGRDNVVGETLELDRQHPLKVTAVIADLPANASNFQTGIFVSGRAAYSDIAQADRKPANARNGNFSLDTRTVLRLTPGASVQALQSRILAMNDGLLPRPPTVSATLRLMQLDALHLSPDYSPGIRESLAVLGVVATLILFLSSVNFVNLTTARAARRGIEVGVRKAAGASRPTLIAQFLGESVLQALFALCVAVAAAECCLPALNAFLQAGAVFDYWRDPILVGVLLLAALAVGILAGAYPAFVMSAFRPAAVLKGLISASPKATLIRGFLVTSQFAVLVVLIISAVVVFEQHQFSIRQSLRFNTDQILFVPGSQCDGAFRNEVAALPGVRDIACSDSGFIRETNHWALPRPDGDMVALNMVGTGPGLLELYGQRLVAGRAIRQTDLDGPGDAILSQKSPVNLVINETAVRQLGFPSPQAAIGHALHLANLSPPIVIVGVVKDFSVSNPERKIDATGYAFFMQDHLLHVKLKGDAIPETLAGIDKAWNRAGATGPVQRTFMNAYVENLHLALLRQGQAFAVFAGIAMLLACLGLFGLSLSTAERRTREIGIRKAMGATSADVLALMLWQFSKPVLWANLIAWPLAWWLMNRWLNSFAYHVPLPLWLFLAAGTVTLVVALLTVAGQTILVARQKPVTALRYE